MRMCVCVCVCVCVCFLCDYAIGIVVTRAEYVNTRVWEWHTTVECMG